jgi:hypothetical protein
MKTSIILLTHNRWQFTEWCLTALYKYTDWTDTELIIVDAESDYMMRAKLVYHNPMVDEAYVRIKSAPKGNIGASIRIGSNIALGEYTIILGNDHIVCPDWNHYIISSFQLVDNLIDVMDYTLPAARYQSDPMQSFEHLHIRHASNISGHVVIRTERLLEESNGHHLGEHATHAEGHYWSWQPWILPMKKAALYPPLPIIDLPRTLPKYPEYSFVERRKSEPLVQEILAHEPWKLQQEYIKKGWTREPV